MDRYPRVCEARGGVNAQQLTPSKCKTITKMGVNQTQTKQSILGCLFVPSRAQRGDFWSCFPGVAVKIITVFFICGQDPRPSSTGQKWSNKSTLRIKILLPDYASPPTRYIIFVFAGMVPRVSLVLRAVPTAPVTPAHRSKAPGGWDWVSPRGPKAPLGSFRRSARTLALAVRVV